MVWWSRRQVSESQHSTNASGQSPSRSDADTRYVSIKLASGNHLTTVVICIRLAHSMVSARHAVHSSTSTNILQTPSHLRAIYYCEYCITYFRFVRCQLILLGSIITFTSSSFHLIFYILRLAPRQTISNTSSKCFCRTNTVHPHWLLSDHWFSSVRATSEDSTSLHGRCIWN